MESQTEQVVATLLGRLNLWARVCYWCIEMVLCDLKQRSEVNQMIELVWLRPQVVMMEEVIYESKLVEGENELLSSSKQKQLNKKNKHNNLQFHFSCIE